MERMSPSTHTNHHPAFRVTQRFGVGSSNGRRPDASVFHHARVSSSHDLCTISQSGREHKGSVRRTFVSFFRPLLPRGPLVGAVLVREPCVLVVVSELSQFEFVTDALGVFSRRREQTIRSATFLCIHPISHTASQFGESASTPSSTLLGENILLHPSLLAAFIAPPICRLKVSLCG